MTRVFNTYRVIEFPFMFSIIPISKIRQDKRFSFQINRDALRRYSLTWPPLFRMCHTPKIMHNKVASTRILRLARCSNLLAIPKIPRDIWAAACAKHEVACSYICYVVPVMHLRRATGPNLGELGFGCNCSTKVTNRSGSAQQWLVVWTPA